MLVYGDVEREALSSDLNSEVANELRTLEILAPGLVRHSRLVGVFLNAAELVQGLLDADFTHTGADQDSIVAAQGLKALTTLAAEIDRSWRSDFDTALHLTPIAEALAVLAP